MEPQAPLSSVQRHTVRRKSSIDAAEQDINQASDRTIPSEGEARIEGGEIEIADGFNWKKKADELAFLEEPVSVIVHESSDPNAEPIIYFGCNGRNQYFIRGVEQTVKRKFVERLASAKVESFSCREIRDENGRLAYVYPSRTTLKYPFQVTYDANPRGVDWLKKILRGK